MFDQWFFLPVRPVTPGARLSGDGERAAPLCNRIAFKLKKLKISRRVIPKTR